MVHQHLLQLVSIFDKNDHRVWYIFKCENCKHKFIFRFSNDDFTYYEEWDELNQKLFRTKDKPQFFDRVINEIEERANWI